MNKYIQRYRKEKKKKRLRDRSNMRQQKYTDPRISADDDEDPPGLLWDKLNHKYLHVCSYYGNFRCDCYYTIFLNDKWDNNTYNRKTKQKCEKNAKWMNSRSETLYMMKCGIRKERKRIEQKLVLNTNGILCNDVKIIILQYMYANTDA
jgi:hypothetical protein